MHTKQSSIAHLTEDSSIQPYIENTSCFFFVSQQLEVIFLWIACGSASPLACNTKAVLIFNMACMKKPASCQT